MCNFEDNTDYRKFTKKSEFNKNLNILKGIIKGISIDSNINTIEIDELIAWCDSVQELEKYSPFKDLIPCINNAVKDNILSNDEIEDILWICDKYLKDNNYYDIITCGLQELQGIFHGILADNKISNEELLSLNSWLKNNSFLSGYYPYDEIYSLLDNILSSEFIDNDSINMLKVFFNEFIDSNISSNIDFKTIEELKNDYSITGICTKNPVLTFENKNFCFTGTSSKTTRQGFKNIVTSLGGNAKNTVSSKTDYLVIGDEGNPCWAYSCYGRKVEQAINIRKKGGKTLIVHENDFWEYINNLE